jgi:multiple antibiotic resistance protein
LTFPASERLLVGISLTEYIVLTSSSLFVIIDPLATAPAFLAMTPNDSPEQRIRTARLACTTAGGILVVFALTGKLIFNVLGITMPAFQMAGSILLMQVALDMLRAQRSRVKETSEETLAGADKTEIAITPLGIPMLAGPGAISTTILLQNQAANWEQHCALYGCIAAVTLASYLILRVSARGVQWLGPIGMSLAVRIMGLLLAAVAVQFMLNGIAAFWHDLNHAS